MMMRFGAFAFLLVGLIQVAPAFAQETWELCPEPSEALGAVPGQLSELQADIDRFTLCLNRAELLMKLEDLKSQNAVASINPMGLPGAMTPAPLTAEQTAQLMGDASAAIPPVPGAVVGAGAEALPATYVIRDIRGVGPTLMARIQSPDGGFETVKVGDRLGDGSEVTSITVTQVTVSENGKVKRLDWQ